MWKVLCYILASNVSQLNDTRDNLRVNLLSVFMGTSSLWQASNFSRLLKLFIIMVLIVINDIFNRLLNAAEQPSISFLPTEGAVYLV